MVTDRPGRLRRTLGHLPLAETCAAAWFCARDPKTPRRVKASLIGALVYFISPIDLIPDFLVLLGYTDDAAVLWMVWRAVRKYVTPAHRRAAKTYLGKA